jgi:hypothetical protein
MLMIFELLYISIGIGIGITASLFNSLIKDMEEDNIAGEDLWNDY